MSLRSTGEPCVRVRISQHPRHQHFESDYPLAWGVSCPLVVISGIPGLYPPDASGTPFPSCDT